MSTLSKFNRLSTIKFRGLVMTNPSHLAQQNFQNHQHWPNRSMIPSEGALHCAAVLVYIIPITIHKYNQNSIRLSPPPPIFGKNGGHILPTLYYWYLQLFSTSGITAIKHLVHTS